MRWGLALGKCHDACFAHKPTVVDGRKRHAAKHYAILSTMDSADPNPVVRDQRNEETKLHPRDQRRNLQDAGGASILQDQRSRSTPAT
jgi:hypothetical protein